MPRHPVARRPRAPRPCADRPTRRASRRLFVDPQVMGAEGEVARRRERIDEPLGHETPLRAHRGVEPAPWSAATGSSVRRTATLSVASPTLPRTWATRRSRASGCHSRPRQPAARRPARLASGRSRGPRRRAAHRPRAVPRGSRRRTRIASAVQLEIGLAVERVAPRSRSTSCRGCRRRTAASRRASCSARPAPGRPRRGIRAAASASEAGAAGRPAGAPARALRQHPECRSAAHPLG